MVLVFAVAGGVSHIYMPTNLFGLLRSVSLHITTTSCARNKFSNILCRKKKGGFVATIGALVASIFSKWEFQFLCALVAMGVSIIKKNIV